MTRRLPALCLVTALLACCAAERPAPPPVAAAAPRPTAEPAAPPSAPAPPPEPAPPPVHACPRLHVELPVLAEVKGLPPNDVPPIVDTSGAALDHFRDKLARLLRGQAKDHVRIAVYGDSNLTRDFTTGGMRRLLQGKYGDAGHGFVALGRPWSHYKHLDVRHGPRFGFASYAVTTHSIGDGGYGYSGIAAESMQTGASAQVGTVDDGPVGRRAGRAGVFYLKKPGYGRFSVKVDGEEVVNLDTAAPSPAVAYYETAMPEGPHTVDFVATTPRRVRLLGAVLESKTPGIVIDSLGVGAMNTRSQAKEDPAVNLAMLQRRPYDLVIFLTGTNDFLEMAAVPGWLGAVIETHRRASPGVSILLASPPDRGQYKSNETNILVGKQRREIARALETGFWDLWAAMGGRDSMTRFHDIGLGSPNDYVHFTQAGGAWVGERIAYALFRDLQGHLARHPETGCDEGG